MQKEKATLVPSITLETSSGRTIRYRLSLPEEHVVLTLVKSLQSVRHHREIESLLGDQSHLV